VKTGCRKPAARTQNHETGTDRQMEKLYLHKEDRKA